MGALTDYIAENDSVDYKHENGKLMRRSDKGPWKPHNRDIQFKKNGEQTLHRREHGTWKPLPKGHTYLHEESDVQLEELNQVELDEAGEMSGSVSKEGRMESHHTDYADWKKRADSVNNVYHDDKAEVENNKEYSCYKHAGKTFAHWDYEKKTGVVVGDGKYLKENETIEEISAQTKTSYIEKAFSHGNELHKKIKSSTDDAEKKKLRDKVSQRNQGIIKAAKSMREKVDLDEAQSLAYDYVQSSLKGRNIESQVVDGRVRVRNEDLHRAVYHVQKIGYGAIRLRGGLNEETVTTFKGYLGEVATHVVKYTDSKGREVSEKPFTDEEKAESHARRGNSIDKTGGKYTVHKVNAKGHVVKEQRVPEEEVEYIAETPTFSEFTDKIKNFKNAGYDIVDSKHSPTKAHITVKTGSGKKTYHYSSTGSRVETH